MVRGSIRCPDLARQLKDFSGLCFCRGITPTDLDGYVEFNDKIFIFLELKYADAPLLTGQRIALERLVDAVGETREALLLVASHFDTSEKMIDASQAIVTKYRYNREWRTPERKMTVREAMDVFLEWKGNTT